MANRLGIQGFDCVEFYVGSAKMVSHWFQTAMGLELKGYLGPEYGSRDKVSYYLTKNKIKILVTSALTPQTYDITSFTHQHGDGIKSYALEVKNVEETFQYALKHHAIPVQKPIKQKDKDGTIIEASIRIYDDTELKFINYDQYKGLLKPGYGKPFQKSKVAANETALEAIDHIVGNVRENEMDRWANYFNESLDFETFIEFGPGDISTKYSALLSKVVRSKDNVIKNPINEPYDGLMKSQIEEFLEEYQGSGIQHIAFRSENILQSIEALRKNGVEFLNVPKTYYQKLKKRGFKIDENMDDLERLGILCDTSEDKGYLLQLFTKPIGDRPTFFFEIIQRKYGAQGFGQGNFQALFESIEEDQRRRGTLTKK